MNETELLARRLNRGMNRMYLLTFVPLVLLGYAVYGVVVAAVIGTFSVILGVILGVALWLYLAQRFLRRNNLI